MKAEIPDWFAFDKAVKNAEVFIYEAGFQPADTSTWVAVREGRGSRKPHPTGDVGDIIAGFYVLEVADLDAAAQWAERIPTASYGKVEVRPSVEF